MLTEYLEFKNGMNPSAKRFGKGTKFISVMDILNNRYIKYDNIRASVETEENDLENYRVDYGDILFQRSSETLEDVGQANVYLDKKPAVFGGFVIRGKKIGNYNPLFFRYLLSSPSARKKIIVKGAGAQHFNIGQDGLSKVCLLFPFNTEQDKIASLLNLIDERISTQIGLIEDLKKLKSAINDMYHDNCEGERISFSEIGKSYSGLSGKSGEDFGNGAPFITYMNVYENDVVDETMVDYVRIGEREKQNKVSYGDLLFSLSSETSEEVGIGAVYLGESEKYFLNSFCFGVHINAIDRVHPPYLAYLVSSTRFRKFVYPLAQGSTRFNLQKNDFMRKKFILPKVKEQKRIARTLDSIAAKLWVEEKLLEAFMMQRQYLLRMMFV